MEFKIGSAKYTIHEITTGHLPPDGEILGSVNFREKKVYIKKDVALSEKRATLLHELCHAILYETQAKEFDTATEEEICNLFGMCADMAVDVANLYFSRSAEEA